MRPHTVFVLHYGRNLGSRRIEWGFQRHRQFLKRKSLYRASRLFAPDFPVAVVCTWSHLSRLFATNSCCIRLHLVLFVLFVFTRIFIAVVCTWSHLFRLLALVFCPVWSVQTNASSCIDGVLNATDNF